MYYYLYLLITLNILWSMINNIFIIMFIKRYNFVKNKKK